MRGVARHLQCKACAVLAAAMLSCGAIPAPAGVDDVEVALARTRPAALDWDPAERLSLAPGDTVRLHLAAGKALRLSSWGNGDNLAGVSLWEGDGNGIRRRSVPEERPGSLVLREAETPRIIDVTLASGAQGTATLRVSVGDLRRDMRGHDYGRAVPLPLPVKRLVWNEPRHRDLEVVGRRSTSRAERSPAREVRDYWIARPGAPFLVPVKGPTRLRVETRLLPEFGGALHRHYRIEWTAGGKAMRPLEFEGTWDLRRVYRDAEGAEQAVTRAETAFLNVPAGEGAIGFTVSRPMLIRVDAIGGIHASSRANTAAGYSAALAFTARPPADSPGVDWGALGGPTRIGGRDLSPEDLVHQARRLARTNAMSNGAMVAADMVSELAAQPGVPSSVEQVAKRLSRAYGYFRDLHPVGPGRYLVETLHDRVPALLSPGERAPEGPSRIIPAEILAGLDIEATFYRARTGTRLDYLVFDPSDRGRMRLLVDRRALTGPVRLRIVPDTGRDIPIVVSTSDELPGAAYAAPKSESGQVGGRSLGAEPGDFGALEFDLPGGVSRLSVIIDGSPANGVSLALQVQQSRVSSLDPPAFRAEIGRLGGSEARHLAIHALRDALDCADWLASPASCTSAQSWYGSVAASEIYNDLIPLMRLLLSRDLLVFDGVRDTPSPLDAAGRDGLDGPAARARMEAGDELLAGGHPIAALEEYAAGLRLAADVLAEAIVFRQVAALEVMGEDFLAERMLRRLALECHPRALDTLGEDFRAAEDLDRLLGLEVRRVRCAGNAPVFGRIATLLARAGQPDLAAKLIVLFPEPSAAQDLSSLTATWDRDGPGREATAVAGGWIGADSLIVASDGALPVSIPSRGLAASWHRAAPGAPVRLRVDRDGVLRLRFRRIHKGQWGGPEAVVLIETSDGPRRIPIGDGGVSEGLVPVHGARGGLGTASEELLRVRAGETISIRPEGTEVTVEVDLRIQDADEPLSPSAQTGELEALRRLAALYLSDPFAHSDVLLDAAILGAPWFGAEGVGGRDARRLWSEIEALTDWERVPIFAASAGTTAVPGRELQFLAPRLRVRAALAANLDRSARALSSTRLLRVGGSGRAEEEVRLGFALSGLPGVEVPTARVVLGHPDGGEEIVTLTARRPAAERRVVLDRHMDVRMRLEVPVVNAFVTVRLDADSGAEVPEAGTDRFYEVATVTEPVVYRSLRPEVLRIDEWRDGRLLTRFVVSRSELVLAPDDGRERGLYRLYRLVPTEDTGPTDDAPMSDAVPDAVADARAGIGGGGAVAALVELPLLAAVPELQIEPGGFGTWELGVSVERRGDARDESGGADRFVEVSAAYRRYWTEWDVFTKSEALFRRRTEGPATIGLKQALTWPDRFAGFDLDLDASLYFQDLGEAAYQLRLSASATRNFRFSDEVKLLGSAEVFFNHLSDDAIPGGRPASQVDRDVYSDYRRDHSRGLNLSLRLDYRPYDDLGIYLAGALRTNEDFNVAAPDQYALELGWDHQIGEFYYKAFVEKRSFRADQHRAASSDYLRYGIVARWDRWRSDGGRMGIEGRLSRRDDRPGAEGAILLRWSLGGGFEDHAPRTVNYRRLREQARLDRIARTIDD